MAPITKAQRLALKRVFDRRAIFPLGLSASTIAANAGWRYLAVSHLPPGLRERAQEAGYHHVWMHGTYTPVYEEADNIVADYQLAVPLTYRQFRKTVKAGFDCLMVEWFGMWLGIEKDGYTHA